MRIRGELFSFESPCVMGILNVTPDSFYSHSRSQTQQVIVERIEQMINEGVTIIDVGGYSSRPDATDVSVKEEQNRLRLALDILKRDYQDIITSVDTFRSDVARMAVEEYGVAMINDISGGMIDTAMFDTVASLQVPYVLMHMRGTPQVMQQYTQYTSVCSDVILELARRREKLHQIGVCDVIIDPGFGFSKTVEQNYELMRSLEEFSIFESPLLVGISRKSMLYRPLMTTPEESLNATTALNTYSLLNGADILRVHDVKQAVEAIKIVQLLQGKIV